MGFSIGILNNIRDNASAEYVERIPVATQLNFPQIGLALDQYNLLYTEFFPALFGKIGKTLIEKKLFKNKLARFKSGNILSQQDVEEIFIEMSKAEGAYDPTGPNPLGRREGPDVKACYHRMNRQDYYALTVGDLDVVRVFRSEATLDSFISGLINSVYSGANYDEWLAMKQLICGSKDVFGTYVKFPGIWTMDELEKEGYEGPTDSYNVGTVTDKQNNTLALCTSLREANKTWAEYVVKILRKTASAMSFPSKEFNAEGVLTWTEPSDLVFICRADLLVDIDVDVLSHAINPNKTDVPMQIVTVDTFSCNEDPDDIWGAVPGILVDKDWFRIWDTMSKMEPQRNAQGLFTNYFYHIHQIMSASPFKNSVVFTSTTNY